MVFLDDLVNGLVGSSDGAGGILDGVEGGWRPVAVDVGVVADVCAPGLAEGRAAGHLVQ